MTQPSSDRLNQALEINAAIYAEQQQAAIAAAEQRPATYQRWDANNGRAVVRMAGGGEVAAGLRKSSGGFSDPVAIAAGSTVELHGQPAGRNRVTTEELFPVRSTAAPDGTPIAFIGLGYADLVSFLPPAGSGVDGPEIKQLAQGRWFEVWVKFGDDAPLRVVRIDQARLVSEVSFVPITEPVNNWERSQREPPVNPLGLPNLTGAVRVCSALSSDLVLAAAEVKALEYDTSTDSSRRVDVFYAALYSKSGGLQSERFIGYRAGLDDPNAAIAWTGGLAPYADWLPTTVQEALDDRPAIAVYGSAIAGYTENRTGDRMVIALAQAINSTSGNHTRKFLEIIASNGLEVAYSVADKNTGNVTLTFPQADLTAMAIAGQFIYGYLDDGFDDLPLAIASLYADPGLGNGNPSTVAIGRAVSNRSILEEFYAHHTLSYSQAKIVL